MVYNIRIQFYLFFKATAMITLASAVAVIQTMFAVYICFLVIIRNYFSPPEKKKGQVLKKIKTCPWFRFVIYSIEWILGRHRKLTIKTTNNRLIFPQKRHRKGRKKGSLRFKSPPTPLKCVLHLFIRIVFWFLKKREKRRKTKKTRENLGFSAVHLFWHRFLVAGVGFEPHDLRVMSPTSYRTALPRDIS